MKSEEAEKSGDQALPAEGQLHKPPSVLWFVIPLALLLIYAVLTR